MARRPRMSRKERENRRRKAIRMLQGGIRASDVARKLGITPAAISQWKKAFQKHGWKGIESRPGRGRPPRVSLQVLKRRLLPLLAHGARAVGFDSDRWTVERVAQVVRRKLGVHYHPSTVWKVLRKLRWKGLRRRRARR